jgi:hypothetical protein
MRTDDLKPGTVLVTRSKGFAAWWIRFGAAIRNKPNLGNHVAVVHHRDKEGTLWVIEGKPGGVGWADAKGYLDSKWTHSNADQPLTEEQRYLIAVAMEKMLGTAYDWESIVADAFTNLGMRLPGWDSKWKHDEVAGQVVCSSAAAYAYGRSKAKHPPGDRGCQPSDWTEWILTRGWM